MTRSIERRPCCAGQSRPGRAARGCGETVQRRAGGHVRGDGTHPAIDLLDLAQEAEGLHDRLGNLDVLWRVLLEHAQENRQRARAHVLKSPGPGVSLTAGGASQ